MVTKPIFICRDDTLSIQLDHRKKVVYTNYRIFLSMDHPFRKDGYLGLRSTEQSHPPLRLNGDALLKKLSKIKYVLGKIPKFLGRKRTMCNEDDSSNVEIKKAWYKRSILFNLDYWSYNQVRHVLDVMHTEKNVGEHLIGTILDIKERQRIR